MSTGSIGKRNVAPAEPAAAPRAMRCPLPEKLPVALRNAAVKGQPAAEYEVGTRLIDGKSVPQNTEEGVRWLERAAKVRARAREFPPRRTLREGHWASRRT